MLTLSGIFLDAFDVGAHSITESVKVAAAHTSAGTIDESDLALKFVVPSRIGHAVSPAPPLRQ